MNWKRIGIVTAGLSLAGAIAGGLVGAVFMGGVIAWHDGIRGLLDSGDGVLFAAMFCAAFGLVLGPLAAWLLMRHVPLWLAIGGTALGTLAGTGLSFLLNGDVILFPLLGFGTSAVALRILVRPKPTAVAAGESSARLAGGEPH